MLSLQRESPHYVMTKPTDYAWKVKTYVKDFYRMRTTEKTLYTWAQSTSFELCAVWISRGKVHLGCAHTIFDKHPPHDYWRTRLRVRARQGLRILQSNSHTRNTQHLPKCCRLAKSSLFAHKTRRIAEVIALFSHLVGNKPKAHEEKNNTQQWAQTKQIVNTS